MLKLLGHCKMDGNGKTMQLMSYKNYLYVGNMSPGIGTAIIDVKNPAEPRVCGYLPGYKNTKSPKVQIANNILIVNYEQPKDAVGPAERVGIGVFDLSDPVNPKEIAYYHVGGKGVHRVWYTGGKYAYLSAVPDGFLDRMFVIINMEVPNSPYEVSKWWLEGQWTQGGEKPDWPEELKCKMHHAIIENDRAYLGYWDAGVIILDLSDIENPKEISRIAWARHDGACTHTALPLPKRKLLVVTDESTRDNCKEPPKFVRVIDINDEKNPKVISKFPVPQGDFCNKGLRFGPHNLHENYPGSYVSDEIIFVTYFNAGLRVVDIANPNNPKEIGSFIPETPDDIEAIQINDVFVEENGRIFISDRVGAGVYILQADFSKIRN